MNLNRKSQLCASKVTEQKTESNFTKIDSPESQKTKIQITRNNPIFPRFLELMTFFFFLFFILNSFLAPANIKS